VLMKSPTALHRRHSGSVLLGACIASGVIFIMILGMLTYISNEYRLNVRSHKWTQSLNLAEAGVEIAFAEFNNYYQMGSNAFASARGWSGSGGTYSYYNANFTNSFGQKVGVVYAYVYGVGGASPYLFAYGGCTVVTNNQWVYRAVEANLANSSQFPVGMLARGGIDMKGNGVTTDSYDSSDTTKSTGKRYDVAKKQPNGDVATNDAIINSVISVQNADIYGRALTGPSGSVSLGANGSIGPDFNNPSTSVADAQSKGWVRNDFAINVPDVILPNGAASWTSTSASSLSAGSYKMTSIGGLTVSGDVKIYCTGDITLNGNAQITINSNSTLTIYCAGDMKIAGNGVVNNGQTAADCILYGLNTCSSVTLQGNANWCGIVYAPHAALGLGGGGSSGDFQGSIIAESIGMNGHVTFHYDEALRKSGPSAAYNIASWKAYRWNGNAWISEM
jgi:hypothetical protein